MSPWSVVTCKKFIWESLLKDDIDSGETTRLALEEKLCETDESSRRFFCQVCDFVGPSFDDFTTHLNCRYHFRRELDTVVVTPPSHEGRVQPTFEMLLDECLTDQDRTLMEDLMRGA
ncbi:hypothetical protein AALP_AA3G269500 [Arabis alpina]|uniref:Uncharacterized protein n=1 Tax=Arabis alpina TaxID=50452 RepID=A0A087HBY4_ARAAL|nr:hypothetical protein AALP_AA3G269500 [Arabis alpina]